MAHHGASGASTYQVRAGAVRAPAVTAAVRVPQLPEVPTLTESGYPDIDVSTWYAVTAPAGTPAPIVERLHAGYVRVALAAETRQFLAAQGLIYLPNDPGVFARRAAAERARWGDVVRAQGIRVE